MGGRKGFFQSRLAQVSLFVLIGFVILLGIVLLVVAVRNQKAALGQDLNVVDDVQGNPELAAEKARMTARVEQYLGQTVEEVLDDFVTSGVQVDSVPEAEVWIEEEIADRIHEAFYHFNTEDLELIDEEPTVSVTFREDSIYVEVEFTAVGEYEGESYTLSKYTTTIPTTLRPTIVKGLAIRNTLLSSSTPTGTTGTGDIPELGAEFIDDECYVDLYAYEDEGIYADLFIAEDGTMKAYLYDYSDWKEGDPSPSPYILDLPECVPV